jgi:hypothetical protein
VRASYSFMMRPARMYRLADDVAHGGGAMWDIGCYAIHSLRLPNRNTSIGPLGSGSGRIALR